MPFIGKQPEVGAYQLIDSITTSATATFALAVGGTAYFPASARNLLVSLNGITQAPDSAYTVSGSNIIFDSALTSSDVIDYILVMGDALDIGTPSDGTVGTAQMNYPLGNFSSTGIDDNADATAITIDSSEQVGIGTSPAAKLHVAGTAFVDSYFSLRTTDDQANSWVMYTHTDDTFRMNYNGSGSDEVTIDAAGKMGIGTSSPNQLLTLGSSTGSATIGLDLETSGTVRGSILYNAGSGEMAFTSGYSGYGGYMTFDCNGAERARILSGGGITFNGDTASANALDDYEEGTWTATLIGDGGTNPTLTYGNQTGYYVKIGNIVTATWYSGALSISNAGSGYAYIQGLPYNSSAASGHYPVASFTHMTACNQEVSAGYLYGNNIRAMVHNSTSLATWTSGTKYLMVSVTYQSV